MISIKPSSNIFWKRRAEDKEIEPPAQGHIACKCQHPVFYYRESNVFFTVKFYFGYLYALSHFYQYMTLGILLLINKSFYFFR